MNLNDFSSKNISQNHLQSKKISNSVKEFRNELKKYMDEVKKHKNRYSEYWNYRQFIEDEVSMQIGISRWNSSITYYDELNKTIEDSVLEMSNKNGTLYRKHFLANGSINGEVYNVQKFNNGSITNVKILKNKIPKDLQNKDIIFQFNEDGSINIRDDLKEEIVNNVSKELSYLKELENRRNNDYKKEKHIYEVIEDDGYIFLNDLTEKRNFMIEDIDFIVDYYNGDGKYQVINGEYKKLK